MTPPRAVHLIHHELAVTAHGKVLHAVFLSAFQTVDQTIILGHVVRDAISTGLRSMVDSRLTDRSQDPACLTLAGVWLATSIEMQHVRGSGTSLHRPRRCHG